MKILKKLAAILSCIIYVIVLAAIIIITPMLAGYRPVVVLTDSMAPTFPNGSLSYYHTAAFDDLSPGDVITYDMGDGSIMTQRIANKDEAGKSFITKGDANDQANVHDVAFNMVFGKVIDLYVPFAGNFIYYLSRWIVIGVMAMILVLNLILNSRTWEEQEMTSKQMSAADYFKDL